MHVFSSLQQLIHTGTVLQKLNNEHNLDKKLRYEVKLYEEGAHRKRMDVCKCS